MKVLILLCVVVAVSQAGILPGGPGLLAGPAGVLAAPGLLGAPALAPGLAAAGLLGAPALAAPGLAAAGLLGAPALAAPGLAAAGLLGAPALAAHGLVAPGIIGAPAIVAPAVVPAAASPLATLSAGSSAGVTALSAAGLPIETPAVQAGRVIDAVAHGTAKGAALLG